MYRLFNLLDGACDALAHAFDGDHAPEGQQSRPHVMFILLAFILLPCALVLGWEWSPAMLGVLGLIGALLSVSLFVIWTR